MTVSSISPVSSISSSLPFSSPTPQSLHIQRGGRWQGGKGKYPRHYEVGVAALVEVGVINDWHIRRCDIARVLVIEPSCADVGDGADAAGSAMPHDEQRPPLDECQRQAFVLLFPPRQYRMVVALLTHMEQPVPFAALFAEGTYDPQRDRLLREKVVKPVRKKLALLGLTLRHLIGYGYLVQIEGGAGTVAVMPAEITERSPVINSPASAPPVGEDAATRSTSC
jgi:hypothetical protein